MVVVKTVQSPTNFKTPIPVSTKSGISSFHMKQRDFFAIMIQQYVIRKNTNRKWNSIKYYCIAENNSKSNEYNFLCLLENKWHNFDDCFNLANICERVANSGTFKLYKRRISTKLITVKSTFIIKTNWMKIIKLHCSSSSKSR